MKIGQHESINARQWRLGPYRDPGWFDTSGVDISGIGKFTMATLFKLDWRYVNWPADGIYNFVHCVSLGRQHSKIKIHLEQVAQVLGRELHITCRADCQFPNRSEVYRNTQPLPGTPKQYLDRTLALIYSSQTQENQSFRTISRLYDAVTLELLQHNETSIKSDQIPYFNFAVWPDNRVICDHEQYQMPRDHVMIHGGTAADSGYGYELSRIWAVFHDTVDQDDVDFVRLFVNKKPLPYLAWYDCDFDLVVKQHELSYVPCQGLYRQSQNIGIQLWHNSSRI